jgi:hypothetical protein
VAAAPPFIGSRALIQLMFDLSLIRGNGETVPWTGENKTGYQCRDPQFAKRTQLDEAAANSKNT